jgi:hypothetical protein
MSFLDDSFDEPDDSLLVSPTSANRSRLRDDRQHDSAPVDTRDSEPCDEGESFLLARTPAKSKFNYASAMEELEFLAPTPATAKATDRRERRLGAVFESLEEAEDDSPLMEPDRAKQQPALRDAETRASTGRRALFSLSSSSSHVLETEVPASPEIEETFFADNDDSPSLASPQANEEFSPIVPTNDGRRGDAIDATDSYHEDYESSIFRHPCNRKSDSEETSHLQIKLGRNVNESYDSTVACDDQRDFRAGDERMVKDADLSMEVEKAYTDYKSGAVSSELLIHGSPREKQSDHISQGNEDVNVSIDVAINQGNVIHRRPKFRPPIDEYKLEPWDSMCSDDSEETTEVNDQPSGYVEMMRKSIDCYFSSQLGSLPEDDDVCNDSDCSESSDKLGDSSDERDEESSPSSDSRKEVNASEIQDASCASGYSDDENKGGMINLTAMGDDASQIDVSETLEYAAYVNSSQHPRYEDALVESDDASNVRQWGRNISESSDKLQDFISVGVDAINGNNPEADQLGSSSIPSSTTGQLELENCTGSKSIIDSSYSSTRYGAQVPAATNDQLDDTSFGSNASNSGPDNSISRTKLTLEYEQISQTKNSPLNNDGCQDFAPDYANNNSMEASIDNESQLAVMYDAESSSLHLDAYVRQNTESSLEMKAKVNHFSSDFFVPDGIDSIPANHEKMFPKPTLEERRYNDVNHSPARLKVPVLNALSSNYLSPILKSLSPHDSCDLPSDGEHATILDEYLSSNSSPWQKCRRDTAYAAATSNEMKSILGGKVGVESSEPTACNEGSAGAHLIASTKDSIFQVLSHQPFQDRDDIIDDSMKRSASPNDQPSHVEDESQNLDQHSAVALYDDAQNTASILGMTGQQQLSPDIESQSRRKSFDEFSSYQQTFNSRSNAFIERLRGAAEYRKREVTSGRISMERKEQMLYEEKMVRVEMSMPAVDEESMVKSPRKAAAPPKNKFEGDDPFRPFKAKPLPASTIECMTLRTEMQSSTSSLGAKRKTSNAFRPHPAQNESHLNKSANVKPPKRLLSGKEASIVKEMKHRNRLQEEQQRIKRESTFVARALPVRTLTRSQTALAGEDLVSSPSGQRDKENKAFIPRSSIRAEKRKSYNLEKAAREQQRKEADIERRHQLIERTKTEIEKLKKSIR